MESIIARNLQPEFAPVAVVWSNTIPDDALQYQEGEVRVHPLPVSPRHPGEGRVAGGNRESITCNGGRAALGLGVDFDASPELLDRYSAVFSKGLKSVGNEDAYRETMEAAPRSWRAACSCLSMAKGRHCDAELAKDWILNGLPRYDIPVRICFVQALEPHRFR